MDDAGQMPGGRDQPQHFELLDTILASLDRSQEAYLSAQPFPHVVIENFLPPATLAEIIRDFPAPESSIWRERVAHETQVKLASNDVDHAPESIRNLMYLLNSGSVLDALTRLTGEGPLIADAHYGGGGMHQIERGGHLAIHSDFSKLVEKRLFRRLNLLIYLNEDWRPEYGGNLELWSRDAKRKEAEISPVANRAVIFTTDSTSFHGHPEPLTCPDGRSRRSLALYYYTAEPPKELHNGIETRWRLEAGRSTTGLDKQLGRLLRRVANRFGSWAGRFE